MLGASNISCGTIFGGSRQNVQIDSSPSTVSVTVGQTGMTQTTPTTFSLLRKNNYVLTFRKEGYVSKKFEIQRKIRGGILALDIIFTGIVGVVVDATTGSWYKLSPENVNVVLTKVEGASLDLPETLQLSLSVGEVTGDAHNLQVTSGVPGVSVHIKSLRSLQR